jgi:hypothetical protein
MPAPSSQRLISNSQFSTIMRGPYERLKYDFPRVWECPECHRKERTGFTATFCFCRCRAKQEGAPLICMKLVQDGVRRILEPVCRPRPDLPPQSAQQDREREPGARDETKSGGAHREPYGKPPRDKRGRGGDRPTPQPVDLQHEQVVGIDLPEVAPPSEVVVTPPATTVSPVTLDASSGNVANQEPTAATPDSSNTSDESV